jgi:HSP20 family protein
MNEYFTGGDPMSDKMPKSIWKKLQTQAAQTLGDEFWEDIANLVPKRGPRIDVFHTAQEVFVIVELPGLPSAEHIRISAKGKEVSIQGEVTYDYPVPEENITHSERFLGRFQRKIALPADVHSEGARAQYQRGLLIIQLAKKPEQEPKAIPIQHFENS